MGDEELIELLENLKAKCNCTPCEACTLGHNVYGELYPRCSWIELMDELHREPTYIDIEGVKKILSR